MSVAFDLYSFANITFCFRYGVRLFTGMLWRRRHAFDGVVSTLICQ